MAAPAPIPSQEGNCDEAQSVSGRCGLPVPACLAWWPEHPYLYVLPLCPAPHPACLYLIRCFWVYIQKPQFLENLTTHFLISKRLNVWGRHSLDCYYSWLDPVCWPWVLSPFPQSSLNPHKKPLGRTVLIPILQLGKLRHLCETPAQDHTQRRGDQNPSRDSPLPRLAVRGLKSP